MCFCNIVFLCVFDLHCVHYLSPEAAFLITNWRFAMHGNVKIRLCCMFNELCHWRRIMLIRLKVKMSSGLQVRVSRRHTCHMLLSPLSASTNCLPGKDPIPRSRGVKRHLTGNNIVQRECSEAALITFMPVNLAFTISPLCGNPTPAAAVRWNAIGPQPRKGTCLPAPLLYKHRSCQTEKLSATIVFATVDKLFFYIVKMSVGLLPDKFSMTQASDLPGGTFTSFCT